MPYVTLTTGPSNFDSRGSGSDGTSTRWTDLIAFTGLAAAPPAPANDPAPTARPATGETAPAAPVTTATPAAPAAGVEATAVDPLH